ncbi:ABC transporter permease [Paenibacillus darwinianus]|uniref:ABC transporter permease n=1 Tax=Paenibacillus darwinianus TaxID=1380763 RepID=A0A9W5RYL5_9BACL|nr:ABC transporter permease subunit [Paenibacillus darwinianus]EXX85017.1 ABC transporter permease [Paenibacillus darwinianus]EXX86279.1 ABC transporter permease [Paenibacillus darwinianus]EXX86627.1 ABC transporter permease [Paenibacillus darwinianus]
MNGFGNLLRLRFLPAAVWGLALLAIWEAGSWFLLKVLQVRMAQSKLPYIHEVVSAFGRYGSTLLKEGWVTLANAGLGLLLGATAGTLLAVLMSASQWMERLAFPYAVASQMVPILGLAPIVYGIVRDDQWARIIIAGYITFFPVALNMLRGLRSAHPSALELMRSYAAKPWSVYWKLRFPASLPGLFGGLKIAAPLAVTGAILVELMGARNGVGVIMLRNLYYGPSHVYMFWSTVVAGALLGVLSYLTMSVLERLAAPWQPEFRTKGGDR